MHRFSSSGFVIASKSSPKRLETMSRHAWLSLMKQGPGLLPFLVCVSRFFSSRAVANPRQAQVCPKKFRNPLRNLRFCCLFYPPTRRRRREPVDCAINLRHTNAEPEPATCELSNTTTFIFNLALTLHTLWLGFCHLGDCSLRCVAPHTAGEKFFPCFFATKKKFFLLLYASAKIINNMQCDNAEKRRWVGEKKTKKCSHKMGSSRIGAEEDGKKRRRRRQANNR